MTWTAYVRHVIAYEFTYRVLIPSVRAVTWTVPLHVAETIAERLEAREQAITPEQTARTYTYRTPQVINGWTIPGRAVGIDIHDLRGDLAFFGARDVIRLRSVRALARAR